MWRILRTVFPYKIFPLMSMVLLNPHYLHKEPIDNVDESFFAFLLG